MFLYISLLLIIAIESFYILYKIIIQLLTIYIYNNKKISLSNYISLTKNYKIKFFLTFKLIRYLNLHILYNILINTI